MLAEHVCSKENLPHALFAVKRIGHTMIVLTHACVLSYQLYMPLLLVGRPQTCLWNHSNTVGLGDVLVVFYQYGMVLTTPQEHSLQVGTYKEVNESVAIAVAVGSVLQVQQVKMLSGKHPQLLPCVFWNSGCSSCACMRPSGASASLLLSSVPVKRYRRGCSCWRGQRPSPSLLKWPLQQV